MHSNSSPTSVDSSVVGSHAQAAHSLTVPFSATLPVKSDHKPDLASPFWNTAATAAISSYHPRSTNHRPPASVRLLHNNTHMAVRFDVDDFYLLAKHTQQQSMVCQDSCVECFIRPAHPPAALLPDDPAPPESDPGYFSFELSAIGTLLSCHIQDWRRVGGPFFRKYRMLTPEELAHVSIAATLSEPILTERVGAVSYQVAFILPAKLLGVSAPLSSQTFSANFYKCGDHTSHPHWGSWNPIGEVLNFHKPDYFGLLRFQ